jgi:hypothetical protein
MLILPAALSLSFAVSAFANQPINQIPEQVASLESRFFYHMYAQDPVEKRLERLELLVFGATQAGTNEERLARLKKVIASRDSEAGKTLKKESAASPEVHAAPPGKENKVGTSSQYPVLNTLEWRVLKKTYPADTLDQRLERMETKVFGQSSPAMAYYDRIDRLKKTVGVGSGMPEVTQRPNLGPMPKARPRIGEDEEGLDGTFPMMPEMMPPGAVMPGNMNQLFQQMDRQMQQMMQMQRQFINPPGGMPMPNIEPGVPGRQISPDSPKPPRYDDPNAI